MGAAGSKASGTPLAKRLQKKVYNAATTLKRGSNSFFAKVRGVFTRKAAPPSTAARRAKAQKHVNMLERLNKAPKGLNWLRKGYYGVKKLFNKKTLANRIASARGKSILARNRAAQVLGLSPPKTGFAGAYNVVSSAKSRSGSARSAKSASSRPGSARSAKSAASASPLSKIRIPPNSASAQARMLAEMQQEEAQAAMAQAAMARAAAAMAAHAAANAGRRSGSRTYAAPNAALARLPLARALAAHHFAPPRAARSRSGSVSSKSNFSNND